MTSDEALGRTAGRAGARDSARPGRLAEARRAWIDAFLPLSAFLVVAALWAAATGLGPASSRAVPSPWAVLASAWDLLRSGALLRHATASLFRVTLGYYLAVGLGVPAGVLLGLRPRAQRSLNAFIQFLRPISPLAWIPLAMLWFGLGDRPAVFLIFLAAFFPIVVPTMVAARRINTTYLRVAANFGLSPWERVRLVILPAILPTLLPALRISLGVAWLVVVAAEMIAVKSGLGYLILDARNALRMDAVIAAMVVIGGIGVALDAVISRLSRSRALGWAGTV